MLLKKKQREKIMKKTEQNLKEFQNNIKCNGNTRRRVERERSRQKYLKK